MNSAETDLKVFWIRADQRWMSLRRQPGSVYLTDAAFLVLIGKISAVLASKSASDFFSAISIDIPRKIGSIGWILVGCSTDQTTWRLLSGVSVLSRNWEADCSSCFFSAALNSVRVTILFLKLHLTVSLCPPLVKFMGDLMFLAYC